MVCYCYSCKATYEGCVIVIVIVAMPGICLLLYVLENGIYPFAKIGPDSEKVKEMLKVQRMRGVLLLLLLLQCDL